MSTTSIDGKEICLGSFGRVQTPELAQEVMSFAFSDKVAMQDKHSSFIALANNSKVRVEVWKFIRDNWSDKIHATLSGNMVVLERFLRFGLNKFADDKIADEIDAFFKDKDTRGYDKGLEVIDDTIRSYAGYKKRDEEGCPGMAVGEWILGLISAQFFFPSFFYGFRKKDDAIFQRLRAENRKETGNVKLCIHVLTSDSAR